MNAKEFDMKTNNLKRITLLAIGLILILSACSSAAEETTVPLNP
jgi:hypothetical protein